MTLVNPSSEFGARVLRRLQEEQIIWLTTLGSGSTPQPSPVWFWWDGTTVLIYSRPNAPKIHNIERNPQVALHFNSTPGGGDVIILTGTAVIDTAAPPAIDLPEYIAKYSQGIVGINMTNEQFSNEYSTAIRFTPQKVRGF